MPLTAGDIGASFGALDRTDIRLNDGAADIRDMQASA